MILTIYPILFFILIFWGARRERGDFFVQGKMLRAAACIGVILHHLAQHSTGYGSVYRGPVTVFNDLGIVFTAVFFFFSGFGLITSVYNKPDYLKTFLQHRLPSVLIPFWCVNLAALLVRRLFYGIRSSLPDLLKDLSGLTLVDSNSWFIIEIVLLYLLFFLLFRLIRKKNAALFLLCVGVILLIRYGSLQGHDTGAAVHWFKGEWWYNSTIAFVFGALYARFQQIDRFLFRHAGAFCILSILLFAAALYGSVYTVRRYGYYDGNRSSAMITLASQTAVCLVFLLMILVVNMNLSIGNRALRYVSRISLELYLIHGWFLDLFFDGMRLSDPLRYALVILCSLLAASVLCPPDRWLSRKLTSLLTPRQKPVETLERELQKKRRKKWIRIAAGLLLVSALAVLFLSGRRWLFAKKEYEEEMEALRSARVGDEVLWGYYNTDTLSPGPERLTWIVLRKDGDSVCLLSREGLAGSVYHHKHEAVSWEESDLRQLINSSEFTDMFSRYERESMVERGGDLVSLLSAKEAQTYFDSDRSRELQITDAAAASGTNINHLSKDHNWDMKGYRSSWWWLRGDNGVEDIYAPIVTVDGTIEKKEKNVNRPNGAVRPVIRVNCR